MHMTANPGDGPGRAVPVALHLQYRITGALLAPEPTMSASARTEDYTDISMYWREAERVAARDSATDGGNLDHAAMLKFRRNALVAAITRRPCEGGVR